MRLIVSAISIAASFIIVAACDSHGPIDPPPGEIVLSRVTGVLPVCSATVHDQYRVKGPDGQWYPTWHPPVDPSGCTFEHEHGRDPRRSNLWRKVRGIPFGYVNAVLDVYDPANPRHEDHVGHKIEWENGVTLQRTINGTRIPIGVSCDFLMKIHQGTHSPDAFTNNLHELQYFVQCSDGTELQARVLSAIGNPGEFVRSCDKATVVSAGPPSPPNSPRGNGVRFIPDVSCIDKYILVPQGQWSQYSAGLYEDWITSNYLRTSSGRQIAYFDPHFAVFSPSRFYDPAAPLHLGRVIDQCYVERPIGERARGGECDASTNYGQRPVTWDDPASLFNGVSRESYFNQTDISNAGGPRVWYTDPFGGHASTVPFTGSVKQIVAPIANGRPFPLESQAFGKGRSYGGAGTHAPN